MKVSSVIFICRIGTRFPYVLCISLLIKTLGTVWQLLLWESQFWQEQHLWPRYYPMYSKELTQSKNKGKLSGMMISRSLLVELITESLLHYLNLLKM